MRTLNILLAFFVMAVISSVALSGEDTRNRTLEEQMLLLLRDPDTEEIQYSSVKWRLRLRYDIVKKVLGENQVEIPVNILLRMIVPEPYNNDTDRFYCEIFREFMETLEHDMQILHNLAYNSMAGSIHTLEIYEYYQERAERVVLPERAESLRRDYEDAKRRVQLQVKSMERLNELIKTGALEKYSIHRIRFPRRSLDSTRFWAVMGDVTLDTVEFLEEPANIDFKWLLRLVAKEGIHVDRYSDHHNSLWNEQVEYKYAILNSDGRIEYLIIPRRWKGSTYSRGFFLLSFSYGNDGAFQDYVSSVVFPANQELLDFIAYGIFQGEDKAIERLERQRKLLSEIWESPRENSP